MKIRLSGTPTSNPIVMFRRNSRGPAIIRPSCGAAGRLCGDSTGFTGERLYQRRSWLIRTLGLAWPGAVITLAVGVLFQILGASNRRELVDLPIRGAGGRRLMAVT
jgi:hypothetical protein